MHLAFVNFIPRILLNHCFQFSWVLQSSQEKSKTMFRQSFFFGRGRGGGVNKVHYGLCENSEFHSFLVLNMRRLLRLQTFYIFIGIKYKCLSQSCFSISLICWGLLSITVRLDGASNQSVAKPNEN